MVRYKVRRPSSRKGTRAKFSFGKIFDKLKANRNLSMAVIAIAIVITSSFVYNGQAQEGTIEEVTPSSSNSGGNTTQTITKTIYVKNEDNVSFDYDDTTIKVQDGKMVCIEDDRILQWHKGIRKWECRKPTHVVFGDLDSHSVEVNGSGELECENDGDVLYWDGDDDQWACESNSGVSEGDGIDEDDGEISIDAPVCTGANKLQWDGDEFICTADLLGEGDAEGFFSRDPVSSYLYPTVSEDGLCVGLEDPLAMVHVRGKTSADDGCTMRLQNSSDEITFSVRNDGRVMFKNYVFPMNDGLANQVLQTNGTGNLSWGAKTPADIDDHKDLLNIQGGTVDEQYHFTNAQHSNLTGFSDVVSLPNVDGSANQILQTDGSGTVSWVNNSAGEGEHNDLAGLQGGDGTDYFHLDSTEHTNITNISSLIDTDGTNGQVIKTDGSGNLTWEDDGTGTDDQTLSFNAGTDELIIEDGNTVDLSSAGINDHNDLNTLQGGTTDEYYHLTSAQHGNATPFLDAVSLPSVDGSVNQILQTDGSGALSWVDNTAGVDEHNDLSGLQGGDGTDYFHLNSTEYTNITNISSLIDTDGTNGQVIKTDGSGNLTWQNDNNIDTDDQTLSFNSGTGELSITDGNTVDLSSLSAGTANHNDLGSIQGGTTNEYYHLTSAQHSNLTGFSDAVSLPNVDGSANQILETDGAGNVSWVDNVATSLLLDTAVWQDLSYPISTLNSGGGVFPNIEDLDGTNINIPVFDGNVTTEEASGILELKGDYKEGTDIIPHINWLPTDNDSGTVVWQIEYVISSSGDVITSATTITVEQATNSTAWEQFANNFPAIDGTSLEVGDQIHFRIFRDPGDSNDDYPDDAAASTIGFYYQADTLGSTGAGSK